MGFVEAEERLRRLLKALAEEEELGRRLLERVLGEAARGLRARLTGASLLLEARSRLLSVPEEEVRASAERLLGRVERVKRIDRGELTLYVIEAGGFEVGVTCYRPACGCQATLYKGGRMLAECKVSCCGQADPETMLRLAAFLAETFPPEYCRDVCYWRVELPPEFIRAVLDRPPRQETMAGP